MPIEVFPGQSFPLGATVIDGGVNFAVFSKNCTGVDLLLFDAMDAPMPIETIRLDPERNRTFYYWHVFLKGIKPGQLYGYRVHGPFAPELGMRFDGTKVLLDPYTRAVAMGSAYDRRAAMRPGDNAPNCLKSVVIDPQAYNWGEDEFPRHPYGRTLIYELHVKGFSYHISSGVSAEKRGTYLGLIEKIPYLKSLGITAIELLPVQHFDPQDAPEGLTNYWGYSPVAFFAPHQGYATSDHPTAAVNEFRDMVKAMHQAGIEVILDVVFNHTAESDHHGPTLSFRGLENRAYYMLQKNRARYADYSGTGNSIDANHSIVRRMIIDCLRYWVSEMHVDGFRFDLASVMARNAEGQLLEDPPILWEIESDPVLAGTKIIAEAWDAAGLYQVGTFIGHRWAEWNAKFRDDVRRFIKGDMDTVWQLAARINGSPDLYTQPDREPNRSINFVTCHDGFTLADLVSYNRKHNNANLEYNRDGFDENHSHNWGVEGPATDPSIEELRLRQIKNFLTILMVAQGTPMILMGDEVRRTQHGNNNAYCQDNAINWLDWRKMDEHAGLLRFVRELIAFTESRTVFRCDRFWNSTSAQDPPYVFWHGVKLHQPDFAPYSHSLAFELLYPQFDDHLHIILNAYLEPLSFELPALPDGTSWHRIVDTFLDSPRDIEPLDTAPRVDGATYPVQAHSAVILVAKARSQSPR